MNSLTGFFKLRAIQERVNSFSKNIQLIHYFKNNRRASCHHKSPGQGHFTMYYESISHEIVQVADATEAANKIKTGKTLSHQALSWESPNGRFYVVSDCHIDSDAFAETAVLQEIDSEFFQIESITAAWINSKQELARYFVNATKFPPINRKTQLIVGKPTNQTAFFTCGCCGNGFNSNVAYQLTFDQDNGYGICTNCEKYY